jgi:hypothetical protein
MNCPFRQACPTTSFPDSGGYSGTSHSGGFLASGGANDGGEADGVVTGGELTDGDCETKEVVDEEDISFNRDSQDYGSTPPLL